MGKGEVEREGRGKGIAAEEMGYSKRKTIIAQQIHAYVKTIWLVKQNKVVFTSQISSEEMNTRVAEYLAILIMGDSVSRACKKAP